MNDWQCYSASLDDFESMREQLDAAADAAEIDPALVLKLELGFEEAVVNIINYSGSENVWIRIGADEHYFTIELVDRGTPFNPLVVNDPRATTDLPLEEREPGGFGIFLIKQTFDRLDYVRENFDDAPANHLTLAMRVNGDEN